MISFNFFFFNYNHLLLTRSLNTNQKLGTSRWSFVMRVNIVFRAEFVHMALFMMVAKQICARGHSIQHVEELIFSILEVVKDLTFCTRIQPMDIFFTQQK